MTLVQREIPDNIQSESCGRVIRIQHNDPGINDVIEMGFNRLMVERSTDGGISFTEITVKSERPVLEEDTPGYTYIDRIGDPSYYYRTRYINVNVEGEDGGGEKCDPSDAIQGAGLAIQNLLTVEELKQIYLFGLDLTDDAGNQLPDATYQFYILSAIEWLEHNLDIKVLPTTVIAESHDYYRGDYAAFNIAQLDNYPVISLDEWRVQYPSGQTVIVYPAEWIRLDQTHGIVRVVPTAGTLSEIVIGQGGSFLPAVFNGMSHLPDLFQFDYTCGFENLPTNLKNMIGMVASFGPLNIFGDLIVGAGIASTSLSIDGLSQSINSTSSATNSGYGARIGQYEKRIKEDLPNLRKFYKGIRMTSI
jgi:hypothetical protein